MQEDDKLLKCKKTVLAWHEKYCKLQELNDKLKNELESLKKNSNSLSVADNKYIKPLKNRQDAKEENKMDGYNIKDLAERDNAMFKRNESNIIEGYYDPMRDRINAKAKISNWFKAIGSVLTLILILWCEYGN